MKKNYFIILLTFVIFAGCNHDKKQALETLDRARTYYNNEAYDAAKLCLDSLKEGYPQEVGVLKEGLQLMREVEVKEKERNIRYCDSMVIVKTAQADSMKKLFVFEKDPKYDDIGKYLDKQQVLERNLKRSYIRSGVNENGAMYIASVYYGKGRIKHRQLRVTAPDKTFTETAEIPENGGTNYAFQDLGMTTEVVTYQNGKDNDVILFIYNHRNERLKADFLGQTPYSLTISEGDQKSLAKTYDLSVILNDIGMLKEEKEKSLARITYLKSKLGTE